MYTRSMENNKRWISSIFIVLFSQVVLCAQNLPVVATYSLNSNDIGENVSKTVNDLIFSFIKELRTYRLLDMRSDTLPRDLRVPDGTDYLFYGSLTSQQDGIKLEMVLKGGPFAVTRMISRVFDNSNRILLESRLLVQELFDQSVILPDPMDAPAGAQTGYSPVTDSGALASNNQKLLSVENIDSLAGSWHAEEGIEKIMILRGGRGVAILSSGVSVSLELLLSNGQLVVRQKGMVNPRQFIDLPDPVAKQASNIAPPLEWRFSITPDQNMLIGTKKTVLIKNDGKTILTMENVILEVNWKRD